MLIQTESRSNWKTLGARTASGAIKIGVRREAAQVAKKKEEVKRKKQAAGVRVFVGLIIKQTFTYGTPEILLLRHRVCVCRFTTTASVIAAIK